MLINDNCIDALKNIDTNSINVIFADPPFNLSKKYNSYKDNLNPNEYMVWSEKWITECCRVLKDDGSIFIHNIPKWLGYYFKILTEQSLIFKHWISWDAPTSPMGNSLQPSHYGILFFSKSNKNKFYETRHPHKRCRKYNILLKDYGGKKDSLHPFGPLVSDVWTDIFRVKHKKYKSDHPCQLPTHLLERIILLSSDENDTILDPFLGSGTSAVAAKNLNRKYIGIEIDKKYFKSCEERLSNIDKISKIGNSYVSLFLNELITIRNNDWIDLKNYFEIPVNKKDLEFKKIKLKKIINSNKKLVSLNLSQEMEKILYK